MRRLAILAAAALTLVASPVAAETVDQIAARYRLAGEVLVGRGDRIVLDRGYGTIDPAGGAAHTAGERWRLASITKQIVAALVVRTFDPEELDRPMGPTWHPIGQLTPRQLLTHHTGLANPDDTPKTGGGVPAFYSVDSPNLQYCLSERPTPGASFAYNNCDYLILGLSLISRAAQSLTSGTVQTPAKLPGIGLEDGDEKGVPGFVGGKPEPYFQLGSFGTAGGYLGTARSVFAFDRSLMTGKFMTAERLKTLWTPEGNGSYQALGQWVFPGRLKGCAAPKRIVQRDGEIYGVQARNFILPDDGIVVIVFTNRSSDDFAFGEVWEGKGFVYDLLSTVACP